MPAALTIVGELRKWRKQVCNAKGVFVFWGHIYGDVFNRFPDGHFIHTSAVVSVEGDLVETRNGHIYKLVGEPAGDEVNAWEL